MRSWLPCSVQVVTDDPTMVLPEFLRSVAEAEAWPEVVIVVDNAPSGTVRPELDPGLPVTWLRNPRPQPMGRSVNQALSLARSRVNGLDLSQQFVVLAKQDILFASNAIELMIEQLRGNATLGFVGPKIRRAHVASSLDGERRELELTETLEVAGLVLGLFGRLRPKGVNEVDQGQYDALESLQPSLSCVTFRWSLLEKMSASGPWVPDRLGYDKAVEHILRRLRLMNERGRVSSGAIAWRLAERSKMR